MLQGKRILLGVCGGIACYKAVEVASQLQQAGALVDVILTEHATDFIQPLTFSSLSHRTVYTNLWEASGKAAEQHISLAEGADLLAIIPATAQTIAKLAHGFADNMLTAVALASTAPLVIAPAMHTNMWKHPATQANVALLQQRGATIIEPVVGRLASGSVGPGRLPDFATLMGTIQQLLAEKGDLAGQKIVVTAGGTHEPIDPVRYIGNRSSGKMGYAIAAAARDRGAQVTLISGPVSQTPPYGIELCQVETAVQMQDAVMASLDNARVLIMSAAVADFRPAKPAEQKIKKQDQASQGEIAMTLDLIKNPDILGNLARQDGLYERLIRVGFAAETQELIAYARKKVQTKKLDLLVANDVSRSDSGFGSDTNKVQFLYANGSIEELPTLPKSEVAHQLLDRVLTLLRQ